jgi:hypothetical protein
MIYDKTTQIFIVFIINHKNTIYLVRLLWWRTNLVPSKMPWVRGCWRTNVSWKYAPPPLSCVHEKFSRRLRVTFKWFVFYFESKWFTGGFFLPSATNVFNFSIGTILQWSTLGYCNLNTYENEEVALTLPPRSHCFSTDLYSQLKRRGTRQEVAFIGQRSGEPLKWRQFDKISKDTISKIKYTALFQNLMKLGWNLL